MFSESSVSQIYFESVSISKNRSSNFGGFTVFFTGVHNDCVMPQPVDHMNSIVDQMNSVFSQQHDSKYRDQ